MKNSHEHILHEVLYINCDKDHTISLGNDTNGQKHEINFNAKTEKGLLYLDIREWINHEIQPEPTANGIALRIEHLNEVIDELISIKEELRGKGLL